MSDTYSRSEITIYHDDGWGLGIKQEGDEGVIVTSFSLSDDPDKEDSLYISNLLLDDVISALQQIRTTIEANND